MASATVLGRQFGANYFLKLAAAATLAVLMNGRVDAVVPSPIAFTVDISPSPRLLDALDAKRDGEITSTMYYDIKYDESCDNPHLRIRARNKPAIMIVNDSDSVAPLTTFTLTINEGPYQFGTGDAGDNFTGFIKNTIYSDSGVIITGSTPSADNKSLTVSFSGLDRGKKAIFNVDFDLDGTDPSAFVHPDYRMVLLGAPIPGQNPTMPASATATFVNAASELPNSNMLSLNFTSPTDEYNRALDFSDTPAYANADIRPYVASDRMEVVRFGIPEPSAAALLVAGAIALAAGNRRNRG